VGDFLRVLDPFKARCEWERFVRILGDLSQYAAQLKSVFRSPDPFNRVVVQRERQVTLQPLRRRQL
jgi:hypothetical protein